MRIIADMSYDFDAAPNREPPTVTTYASDSNDLETIVTLMELAAIYLTPTSDSEFTFDQLMRQANEIGGGQIVLDERDVKIVIGGVRFLEKLPGKRYRLI